MIQYELPDQDVSPGTHTVRLSITTEIGVQVQEGETLGQAIRRTVGNFSPNAVWELLQNSVVEAEELAHD